MTLHKTYIRYDDTTGELLIEIPGTERGRQVASAALLSKLLVAPDVVGGGLTDDEIKERSPLFPPWQVGIAVSVGDLYKWGDAIVECLQAHTTQSDWTPDVTPALWRIYGTPAPGSPWQANTLYNVDDQVTYLSILYRCLQSHTSQVGWEPPNVPALWAVV